MKATELMNKLSDFVKELRRMNSNTDAEKIMNSQNLSQMISTIRDQTIKATLLELDQDCNDKSVYTRVSQSLVNENPYREAKNKIEQSHSSLHKFYDDVIGEEARLLRLDKVEKRRFLRYRIYTAIGIAAVIFALATLSHYSGIPLPLSGMKVASG